MIVNNKFFECYFRNDRQPIRPIVKEVLNINETLCHEVCNKLREEQENQRTRHLKYRHRNEYKDNSIYKRKD